MNSLRVAPIILIAGLLAFSGCNRRSSRDETAATRMLRNALQMMDVGKISAARDSAAKAAELFQNAQDENGLGEAHRLLGEIEGSEASFENAFSHYAASIRHFTNAGDKIGALGAEISVMDLYSRMGLEEEAYAKGEELLRLADVTHDVERTRIVSAALLPIARTLGKTGEVETLLKQQLHAADSTGDTKRKAWLLDQAGVSELDAPQAVNAFTQARALAEQARDTMLEATVALHLGHTYAAMGDIPDAISTFANAIQRVDSIPSLFPLRQELFLRSGNVLLRAKRPAEAIRYFQAALTTSHDLGDELARRYALIQLSNALRQVDPASSLPIVRQALEGLDQSAPPSVVAYANGTAGLCELAANEPVEALASLQKAVDAVESEWSHRPDDVFADCEQAVMGPGRTPWHDEAIDLLLRMGKNEDALAIALRRSAWNLFRDLDRISPSVQDQPLGAMLARWHAVRAQCNGAEEQLLHSWISLAGARERAAAVSSVFAQSTAEAESLGSEIASVRQSLGCFVSSRAPTPAELRQDLPEGTLLLMYGTTPHTLQIFVVNRRTVTTHSVSIDRSQLTARCETFINGLGSLAAEVDSLTDYQPRKISRNILDQAGVLYETYLRPVERDLGQAQRVLIVQSDDLPFVPLGALRRNGMAGSSLIERLPVSYVLPSTMTGTPVPGTPVKDVLAFGGSGVSGRDGEYEVRDIKASFNDARFYFGRGISLASLAGEHADLAHLVLDIHWDEARPANSFVWMADPQSGIMKSVPVGDYVRLPVFPSVVIHNLARNCSAAAGRIACIPFAAGSRIVIVNSVGTGRKSTKGFVEALSTELATGKGVSEAYRAAILGIIKSPDALPAFWMPFVLWNN